jgi:adenosine deaminase
MSELRTFIEGLPKAELHVHVEGTLEPALKFELAARNRIELPYGSVEEMRAAYDFKDLSSFLAMYYEGMGVLLTEPDFYDLAMAYFRTAHSQNVVYAEVFFDPQAHMVRGIEFDTFMEGFLRAQRDAESSLDVRSGLIMCFLRDMAVESAYETLERSMPYKDRIIGVGLDSDERDNPPIKFKDVFARARREGYRLTMHCDVDQQNSVMHIWECLNDIGVERIDHGVNSVEDDGLIRELNRRGLGLTICPISNSYVTGSLKAAEIKRLLDLGVRVSINSDDPAYFPGYMNENLIALAAAANLSRDEIVRIVKNGFAMSWLPDEDKRSYLSHVDAHATS